MSTYYCLYGGHYGSEGKGSLAEYFAKQLIVTGHKLVVLGENSPNSGHTCTLGKTRNLPASSFFAELVILGPDSVIDLDALTEDMSAIKQATGKLPHIYIHQNAALMNDEDKAAELNHGVVARISGTGSGSGAARCIRKQFERDTLAVVGSVPNLLLCLGPISVVNHSQYMSMVTTLKQQSSYGCLFECSQGSLLDINWGTYPYCTSRSTLARVAIERNGLGELPWEFAGVYRTYPIRTGGPSGPTGGKEISFADIDQKPEIATVTKRTRRIFEFNRDDFLLSLRLNRPKIVAFTHLDYLNFESHHLPALLGWLSNEQDVTTAHLQEYGCKVIMTSSATGDFYASTI